ncbi:hypothetical protein MNBD_CHLOROFLEXI01-3313 [hydrothermal vent metagenome]|uniref:Uncharacterized protein n=1 Tax=hydrothermal vent metagenome TaxID=652676 RepID=A0A3B0UWM8_9ZZZZ
MNMKHPFYSLLKSFVKLLIVGRLTLSYLEPGSSSFLLKILISSLVELVVFFRQIWGYFLLLISKLTGNKTAEPATAVSQQPSDNEVQ